MDGILFVHGTGVRDGGYHETMSHIADGLMPSLPGINLSGVSWGSLAGVNVSSVEIDNILPLSATQGVGGATLPEISAELWSVLMDDPLFELRLASTKIPAQETSIQIGVPTGPQPISLEQRLRQLTRQSAWPSQNGEPGTPAGGITLANLQKAADWLVGDPVASEVLSEAIQVIPNPNDPALIGATARAVVAHTLANERGELGCGPDALFVADVRSLLTKQVERALSEGVMGGFDWLGNLALRFAEAKVTSFGKSRRASLMGRLTPGVGDILLWQRRGAEKISLAILEAIHDAGNEITVIGHSLGGIMLVDLLSGQNPPANVKKLVTVGSQAPFFLLTDSLQNLRRPGDNARPFTPWLNIFDRSDFLSFCAGRSFPGADGIEDFEVVSGVPFPESHGAYWRSKDVYRKIASFCLDLP